MVEPVKINRVAKGKRPVFMPAEPIAERTLAVVSALVTELAVMRERIDTLERLADSKGLVRTAEIEDFAPDSRVLAERERWRQAYMDRVFAILDQDVAAAGER